MYKRSSERTVRCSDEKRASFCVVEFHTKSTGKPRVEGDTGWGSQMGLFSRVSIPAFVEDAGG
jgi:hypothetical protein